MRCRPDLIIWLRGGLLNSPLAGYFIILPRVDSQLRLVKRNCNISIFLNILKLLKSLDISIFLKLLKY